MTRTLVVTNDFPPRPGGIQQFVHGLVSRMADDVLVYAPAWKGAAAFDAQQPFEVVRHPTSLMVPEPRVLNRARDLARSHGADRVLFGAAAPLGLLAPRLRSVGIERSIGLTHGHEAGWTDWPGTRQLITRVGRSVDVLTYLGEYTRQRIAQAIGVDAAARMTQLTPGVDAEQFRPDAGGSEVRAALGLADRPVVVCVSRLMPRKGQDTLIKAWPIVRASVPDAALLIVGGGPSRGSLEKLAASTGVDRDVVFTGSVPWEELPAHYGAGDVFAMPCRTRNRGLDVEGLGIVYLEASACGLPVVAGDSGGAPDAVEDGVTGHVVRGTSEQAVADAVIGLLKGPDAARRMGDAGRAWVQDRWSWDRQVDTLKQLLA